jgi:hypothetical protein
MKITDTKISKTVDKPLEFYDIEKNTIEYVGVSPRAKQIVFKSSGIFGNFEIAEIVNEYGVSFRSFRRGL